MAVGKQLVKRRFCILLLLASLLFKVESRDDTLKIGTTGSDVVQAVIAKLDASGIALGDDHRLLRRLAFVETADGTTSSSTNSGGLWNINQDKLDVVRTSSELAELRIAVKTRFGIDWESLTLQDLGKPFLSGIVAKLYLIYLKTTKTDIPLAGDIQGQALFWLQHYHSNQGGVPNTDAYFVEQIDILEEREGCKVNLDIFFVLDGSASIGDDDFEEVRQFEYEFVKQLRIGPDNDQVGTIVFGNNARIEFYLNTYSNYPTLLLDSILNIRYPTGSTNTADGLCKLVRYGFADGHGARPSSGAVFRIAIVMTDGKSNLNSTVCNWDTLQAAEAVHQLNPPVLVYAIGVTDDVDDEELNAIATGPDYVVRLASFDQRVIQEAQESHVDEVCRRATLPADTSEELNATLDANETVRYHFQVPVAGITVQVCISVGHITVYGSYSVPNPNSALYDFILDFESDEKESEKCKSSYIDPDKISSSTDVPTANSPDNSLTDKLVYLGVVGIGKENNFVINGSVGDIFSDPSTSSSPTTSSDTLFLTALAVGAAFFLVIFVVFVIFCALCCCCMICRVGKTTTASDQYDLVSNEASGDTNNVV